MEALAQIVLQNSLVNRDQVEPSLYIKKKLVELERFSFECQNVIGFAFTTLRYWFKKLAPLLHPIRSKTKTNRD